jgi:toxin ParE1/3/4
MSQYQFTEQAQQDLIQIRRFTLDNWGETQSNNYLCDLDKMLQLLSEMPLMGKSCFDDLGEDVYRFPYGSHVIYYLTTPKERIVIVAVLHKSMVPRKHLEKRL